MFFEWRTRDASGREDACREDPGVKSIHWIEHGGGVLAMDFIAIPGLLKNQYGLQRTG